MKSKVAQEIFELRDKMLDAIKDEPARYQTEVAKIIRNTADHLTAIANIHEQNARKYK